MKTNSKIAKRTFWTVAAFYFIIAFEFFYMASPFAAYFYSVYKPGLSFLNEFPAISWLTGFFLPHIVESTNSSFLNSVKIAGASFAAAGLLVFLVCAIQVYYAKIFKRGAVTGGLYKFIRHPQYTAFAVCSFGLLLLWPRYLVLIMFITLLFAYYLLAKAEEKECSRKFGKDYDDYLKRTNRFIPFKIQVLDRLTKLYNNRIEKVVFISLLYVLCIVSSLLISKGFKKISVNNLHTVYKDHNVSISVLKKSPAEIEDAILIAENNPKIKRLISNRQKTDKLITYLLPADMYISEIPMERPENATSHVFNNTYESNKYKLIYTIANFKNETIVKSGNDILMNALSTTPLLEVWIDLSRKQLIKITPLKGTQRYENIPEPIF